jgi:predicted transcriptional regulator
MDDDQANKSQIVELTAEIVSAYVANNAVRAQDLPTLIASVHTSVQALGSPPAPIEADKPVPAVPVKRSITPDHLISLEDGRRYKSLKRHLTGRGMTPAQYRAKWGLPHDYPMVAPAYARQRSELAIALGLGQQRRKATPETPAAEPSAPVKRGRPKKA